MNMEAVGRRIKEARMKNGWTQEQLAEKVNLSSDHISVIERGSKPPRFETFIVIANALEVDANSLLSDVLAVSPKLASSLLSEKLSALPASEQKKILRILDTLIQEANGQ
ncbi:MAG: helix-turn-helix transcriptional regulator [Oscillospiraceae bacterium]|nr:helix-turn-helix transcriptional regulator [Oscillospiraceae bacterium]